MTIISDLSWELVEEILSRVSITSLTAVGSTCKQWRTLIKDESFTKKHLGKATKEYMITMTSEYYFLIDMSQTRFSRHDIKGLSSVKEIGELLCRVNKFKVVYQCDGLLLLVTQEPSGMVVWNPYLVQARWIQLSNDYHLSDLYAIGYDNKNNHKILRLFYDDYYHIAMARHEIYNFKSNSWRVLDIIPSFYNISFKRGVSLKGNTYFLAHKGQDFVICFDFTTEIFGPRLHLPLELNDDVILSCVREEQLAVLFVRCRGRYEVAIWITTRIESNAMSWSKFFKVDIQLVRKSYFLSQFKVQSFFVDKKKKRAVVCGKGLQGRTSIVVGEDGCFEKLDLIDVFSYVPSSVQIQ